VHKGYRDLAVKLEYQVHQILAQPKNRAVKKEFKSVVYTGHSLGAAVAAQMLMLRKLETEESEWKTSFGVFFAQPSSFKFGGGNRLAPVNILAGHRINRNIGDMTPFGDRLLKNLNSTSVDFIFDKDLVKASMMHYTSVGKQFSAKWKHAFQVDHHLPYNYLDALATNRVAKASLAE